MDSGLTWGMQEEPQGEGMMLQGIRDLGGWNLWLLQGVPSPMEVSRESSITRGYRDLGQGCWQQLEKTGGQRLRSPSLGITRPPLVLMGL